MLLANRQLHFVQVLCFIVAAWSVLIPRGVIGVPGCASTSCPTECDPCEETADAFEAEFFCHVRRLRSMTEPLSASSPRWRRPVSAASRVFSFLPTALPVSCRVVPGIRAPLLQ